MKSLLTKRLESPALKKEKRAILSRPVHQIDLGKAKSIADLVESFHGASIQARNIGAVAKVYERMLLDSERPTILLGLAGPLIAAGLRKVIRDMVEFGLVDVIVSTGAILYQDYYQAQGYQHYFGTPNADDSKLRELFIDRIYDTYVDEEKFASLDSQIGHFADQLPAGTYSSRSFLEELSKGISDPNSILGTAYKRGIPVFAPALNDSSVGIGLTEHYHRARSKGLKGITIDAIRDNYELTQIVVKSKRTSAVYVAGGVPKNFINDSIVMAYIFGRDTGGHKYAVQVTADSPHWGGLSGSTLSEARSWGKVNREASTAMAFIEPSVSLPLIAGYLLQKEAYEKRSRISFSWKDDGLQGITYSNSDVIARQQPKAKSKQSQGRRLLRRPAIGRTPRNDGAYAKVKE